MWKKNQMEFKSKLISTKTSGNKSDKQIITIFNIKKFYKSREEVTKFYNDYFKMVHETTFDSKHDKRVKTVTPQGLPKSLAQVRAGNTSENILNEVRQVIHYLY